MMHSPDVILDYATFINIPRFNSTHKFYVYKNAFPTLKYETKIYVLLFCFSIQGACLVKQILCNAQAKSLYFKSCTSHNQNNSC